MFPCPKCSGKTKTRKTQWIPRLKRVARYHICIECGHSFHSKEVFFTHAPRANHSQNDDGSPKPT